MGPQIKEELMEREYRSPTPRNPKPQTLDPKVWSPQSEIIILIVIIIITVIIIIIIIRPGLRVLRRRTGKGLGHVQMCYYLQGIEDAECWAGF